MMGRVAVLAALVLAGCATTEPARKPLLEVRTIEVPKIIKEPCLAAGDIEPLPKSAMPPGSAGIDQKASGAAADATALYELAKRQQDLLRACAKLSPVN